MQRPEGTERRQGRDRQGTTAQRTKQSEVNEVDELNRETEGERSERVVSFEEQVRRKA